ncbi:hypothetical protein Clacol_000086 [Clathrus columnatus]|uniref:Transmembrane protein n=1 Tax=Clathrus columnatus TaxID=1419009 RepID=A0AAV4ZY93_9AGAM|nr:hypothetical protein Clacol_000086 [Clathrus columnatus]
MTYLNFTFQDPSPLISYSVNQWVEGTTNDSSFDRYSGGSFKWTPSAGATANLTFVGTSITISGAKRGNHGNYSVVLDEGPEFVGDGNSMGNDAFQFPLWNAQNLNNTQHNVIMTNIVTNQGNNLDIDFISIGREIGPPGFTGPIFNVTIDDESPFVTYSGSWSSSPFASAFNDSLHSTVQEGSSVSVLFQGSSIELYGHYVNAPFQARIDDGLTINQAGTNAILSKQEGHPRTLLFLADGLDENEMHSAILVNSVSDSNRPLYFDFAIVRGSQKLYLKWAVFRFFDSNPNSNFTIPASASTLRNAPSTATGTIAGGVVGGVAGLVTFALILFILIRRSKCYPRTTEEVDAYIILPSSTEPIPSTFPVTPGSPLTHTNLKNTRNSNQADLSQQSHFHPLGLTPSAHGLSQEVSSYPIDSIGAEQRPLPHPNSFYENSLIPQTYILQEQDAGRLVVPTRLPPIYDDTWQNDASL